MRRLLIADVSLTNFSGHHYSLTDVISKGALKKGFEIIWLTNTNFSEVNLNMDPIKVRPTFKKSMYDLFKYKSSKAEIENIPNQICEELRTALLEYNINGSDHLIFHTCDGNIYRAILKYVVKSKQIKELPNIHLVTPYDSYRMPHYNNGMDIKSVIMLLKNLRLLGKKVFLYAENTLLANDLYHTWGSKITALDIPIIKEDINRDAEMLKIAYIGAAREEKGFDLLPDVIHELQNRNIETKDFHFTIQCSPQIVGYLPVILNAINRLETYPQEFVTLIKRSLSQEEYNTLRQSSDVLLLIYDRKRYKVRGSGIAVEAISSENIIITTPGTFPAYICGEAAVIAASADEIADKLIDINENKSLYTKRAKNRKDLYLSQNSAESYIDKLLREVSGSESYILNNYPKFILNSVETDANQGDKIIPDSTIRNSTTAGLIEIINSPSFSDTPYSPSLL